MTRHAANPVVRLGLLAGICLSVAACGDAGETDANRGAPAPSVELSPAAAVPEPGPPGPAAEAGDGNAAPASIRRCGWLHNPTPGNWWLVDRDGEWLLGTQGGRQAEGMDEMPDMTALEWQETSGHYGYGCACLTLTADAETREVLRFADPEPKPLAVCRADAALPEP